MRVGDRIKKINGRLVRLIRKTNEADLFKTRIYWESNFDNLLRENNKRPTVFTVQRGDEILEITATAKESCPQTVSFVKGKDPNAYTDGKAILITEGMLDFADDGELALVIAHELAHCVEGHIDKKRRNTLLAGILGVTVEGALGAITGVNQQGLLSDAAMAAGGQAFSQEFEQEADYVGLYLLARAGYDIEGAEMFWRRMAESNPVAANNFHGTHPSTAYRYVLLARTQAEIEQKKAKGLPLLPNRKSAQ